MVWGEKQNGEKAIKANNTFLPEMYQNIWNNESLSDPIQRSQIEAIQCHVGQIPPQLFDNPHPKRMKKSLNKSFISEPISVVLTKSKFIIASFVVLNHHSIKASIANINGDSNVSYLNIKSIQSQKKKVFKRIRSFTTNKSNFVSSIHQLDGLKINEDSKTLIARISSDSSIIVGQDLMDLYKSYTPRRKAIKNFVLRQNFL